MSRSLSVTRAQTLLSQRAKLLTDMSDALNGGPRVQWSAGERSAYTAQLRALGFELVTKGQDRARGVDIAPGTEPVGRGEFGPPLSKSLDLYILEIHGTELVEEPPPAATDVPVQPAQPKRTRKKKVRAVHGNPAVPETKPEIPSKTTKAIWLTIAEAASYLGETDETLQRMRYEHVGPAYQRNGTNVMYRSTDLDVWLSAKA